MRKRHQGLTVLHLVFIDQFDHIRTADTDHNRGTSHRDQVQLISNQGQHSCGPEHPEHHHQQWYRDGSHTAKRECQYDDDQ